VKTIAFFNNKGGVGKTTLCFHLSHMLSRMGLRVLAVDLDPQANLTASFCTPEDVEAIWADAGPTDIAKCLAPLDAIEVTPLPSPVLRPVTGALALLPGSMDLGKLEGSLADAWLRLQTPQPGAHIRWTIAFWTLIQRAADHYEPDVVLLDVGPNLGAITRAALLATDQVVVPLAADVFSIQGLRNLGPTLRDWQKHWGDVRKTATQDGRGEPLPIGTMQPAGYVVLQHVVRKDRPVKAFARWFERIPAAYWESVLQTSAPAPSDPSVDPHCLGQVKNYQSLMPLSQDANKPMFDLTSGDGAIGGHQNYVQACRENFRAVAERVVEACELQSAQHTSAASL